jgi:hypothetical protein
MAGIHASWPGLTRPSVKACAAIDGRVKPGHDKKSMDKPGHDEKSGDEPGHNGTTEVPCPKLVAFPTST